MEENQMIKFKLNFFQKMRKSLYLRNMNQKKIKKYKKLPAYLKNDEDVIKSIVKTDETWINKFDLGVQKRLVRENPNLLQKIYTPENIVEILNEHPSFVTGLQNSPNGIYNFLYNDDFKSNKEFVKYLPKDFQKKLLITDIKYYKMKKIKNEKKKFVAKKENINLPVLANKSQNNLFLDKISPDVIIQIAKEDIEKNENNNKNVDRLASYNLKNLSENTQLNLLLLSAKYLRRVCDNVAIQYINNNLVVKQETELIKKLKQMAYGI